MSENRPSNRTQTGAEEGGMAEIAEMCQQDCLNHRCCHFRNLTQPDRHSRGFADGYPS